MRKLFTKDSDQKQFDENGYVVIDLFSDEEVSALMKVYEDNKVDESQGLQLTIKNSDVGVNKTIHERSQAIAKAAIERVLSEHRVIYSGFIAKLPHKPNTAGVHRDPALVDETKYRSLVIWCPMIDTDEKNGALYMVRNSNQVFPGYKCFDYGKYDYKSIEEVIQKNYSSLLKMKKGQAVIYDTAILHFSYQNESPYPRVVYSSIAIPSEASLLTYHHNRERNTLDVYAADSDFLLSYYQQHIHRGDLERPLIARTDYESPISVTLEEFDKAYRAVNGGYNPSSEPSGTSLLSRIKHWLGR